MREAADRIANMNTHILALQKEIENLHMDRLPETATQPKTDLKPDTQTVKTPSTTTCFCGLWVGTVEMAKTTTNFCSAFTTTFGSGFCPKKRAFPASS